MRILLLLFLSVSGVLHSQAWEWALKGGGYGGDKANDIALDENGNVYVGGFYNYPSSFGSLPTPGTFGKEGFLIKITPNGNWVWLNAADGGWDERVLGIHVDTVNGFVYATGTCWYSTNFGSCSWPLNTLGSSDEIFIAKFDYSGNCIWLQGAGGDSDDHGYDLVTDKAGNIYLTGFISDEYWTGFPAYFGNLQAFVPPGDSTAFVAKMSPSGNFLWVKTFEAIDGERDNRIAIDSAANIYITGGFWGTKNLGMGNVSSNGGVDIFVTKFDSAGNQLWVRTTGSSLSDRGNSITVDEHQLVYITGEFRDEVWFGTDTINNHGGPGGRDIFVAKITSSGNWIWGKRAGSNGGGDRGNRIVADKNEHLYITGQTKGTSHFGNNVTLYCDPADSIQIFVAGMDTNGKWRWAVEAGGPLEDRGNSIAVDDSCNLYITGYFQQTAYFDSLSITVSARRDVFIASLDSSCHYFMTPPVDPEPPPPSCEIVFPNVLTPNGDGKNDKFSIPDYCYKSVHYSVYNRWGELISTSTSPSLLWDGMNKGKKVSEGTYYYVCATTDNAGQQAVIRGFLQIFH
ncbi:MAG: gliding motility-associated C-terminal domain-containing protein [Bacteroidia bacterium]|nr:gliding motility-associated C-terminal domain-containing protein [Bacteroidia bacterium]